MPCRILPGFYIQWYLHSVWSWKIFLRLISWHQFLSRMSSWHSISTRSGIILYSMQSWVFCQYYRTNRMSAMQCWLLFAKCWEIIMRSMSARVIQSKFRITTVYFMSIWFSFEYNSCSWRFAVRIMLRRILFIYTRRIRLFKVPTRPL